MILADTSAWVEYDRATGSAGRSSPVELITADGPVAVTEPVIMEVSLERAPTPGSDLRRLLLRFHLYQFDAAADFEPPPASTADAGSRITPRD